MPNTLGSRPLGPYLKGAILMRMLVNLNLAHVPYFENVLRENVGLV